MHGVKMMDNLNVSNLLNIYENEISKNVKNKRKLYDFEINKMQYIEDIIKMLKNGCRENPLNTLKIAGVDMEDKEVYESAIRMFDEAIEEFRTLSNEK